MSEHRRNNWYEAIKDAYYSLDMPSPREDSDPARAMTVLLSLIIHRVHTSKNGPIYETLTELCEAIIKDAGVDGEADSREVIVRVSPLRLDPDMAYITSEDGRINQSIPLTKEIKIVLAGQPSCRIVARYEKATKNLHLLRPADAKD